MLLVGEEEERNTDVDLRDFSFIIYPCFSLWLLAVSGYLG
jgi:hypothetical protein